MILSASQIKTFNASKAKRAWQYLLGIKDEFKSDALPLWQLFELRLTKWVEDFELIKDVAEPEKVVEQYDNLKHNAEWLDFKAWYLQVKCEWTINGSEFVWYIDNITDWVIEDIKTAQYLTKQDNNSVNMRSWLSTMDEYALQLRIYMKLTWIQKARIIEVSKHKYKDEQPRNQIIEFEWSDERDNAMQDKWYPVMDEMKALYQKYNNVQIS